VHAYSRRSTGSGYRLGAEEAPEEGAYNGEDKDRERVENREKKRQGRVPAQAVISAKSNDSKGARFVW
jgi:hypothetical protein